MNVQGIVETILDENRDLLAKVPREPVERFLQGLSQAERIFCAAQGRSGYTLRCFCMRLMHLGYRAYFVGETITPAIGRGDILVALSGSGQTTLTHELIKLAQQHGATTYGIIGVEDSPAARTLNHAICLPGEGSKESYPDYSESIQPPGSLFEQAAFVLLETIVVTLYQKQGSDRRALWDRHTNLE